MAVKDTGKAGIPVRFFRVAYTRAEINAHHEATREMLLRGVVTEWFGCAPGPREGMTHMSFLIVESEADAYVKRIKAAS